MQPLDYAEHCFFTINFAGSVSIAMIAPAVFGSVS